jgi:hypothetical protein
MNENELYPPAHDSVNNEVQPGIAISPEVNPAVTPPKKSKSKGIIAIILLLAIIIGLGVFGYMHGYSVKGFRLLTPAKIWDKFYTSDSEKIYNSSFTADYNDPESLDDAGAGFGVVLKNIKVHLEGSTYANLVDTLKPQIDGTIKFTVASGNSSFSSGIDYRALNGNVFYKVGDIPFLSGLMGTENKNVDWVKINLEKAKSQTGEQSNFFQGLSDATFQDKIRQIWLNNRAIKLEKYIGREKIGGVSTLHFQAALDKDATKKAAVETITELATLDKTNNLTDEDKTLLNAAIDQLVRKIEIKELDAWVGVTDQHLYKLHLASNAPSLVSLIKLSTSEAQSFNDNDSMDQKKQQLESLLGKLNFDATFNFDATYSDYGKTRAVEEPAGALDLVGTQDDAKRIADIRQTASALELYFNDNNGYPPSLANLTPAYITVLPSVPTPPGGNCSAEQNNYTYSLIGPTHYTLTFCLGTAIGGYPAGPHTLSEAGVN